MHQGQRQSVFCKVWIQMHLFYFNLIVKWFCVVFLNEVTLFTSRILSMFSHNTMAKFSSDNIWDNCLCKMHEDFRTWPSRSCSHPQCKGLERSFKHAAVFSFAPVVDREELLCWCFSCHALLINGSQMATFFTVSCLRLCSQIRERQKLKARHPTSTYCTCCTNSWKSG